MANFEEAHRFTARAEGGYQADERDGGNWTGGKPYRGKLVGTNWGIAAPTLRAWRGRDITAQEMQELSEKEAQAIFRRNYWDALALDDLPDQQLALLLYDGAVNQGLGMARRALLYALQMLRVSVASTETTRALVARIAQLDASAVHELVWQYRRERYPKSSPFIKGWLRRLDKLRRA